MDEGKNKDKPGLEIVVLFLFLVSAVMFCSVFLILKHKDFFTKILLAE